MKPVLRLPAAIVFAALAFGLIPPGEAMAQMAKLQGTYLLGDPAALPKIKRAVDKVADQMGFFAASIARDRLMEANKPAQRLVITSLRTLPIRSALPTARPSNGRATMARR